MPEHADVYRNETDRYHSLVSFEDFQHNLPKSLNQIIGGTNNRILESGAGTGRVTKLLAENSQDLVGFDLSEAMLSKANCVSSPTMPEFRGFAAADQRLLPVDNDQFDWVVSGWSVCYLVSWLPDNWQQEIQTAMKEFLRVLKHKGKILLIETLGTGKIEPDPPSYLANYLNYLDDIGFQHSCIRTDYRFPDQKTAKNLVEFFFGSDMLPQISSAGQPILPECTGLWVGTKQDITDKLPY
ncbi:MAG TPA: methyltransferase domain-containing protein [Leptolinea sp.]